MTMVPRQPRSAPPMSPHNSRVLAQQLQAGFAWAAASTRGDDDHIGIRHLLNRSRSARMAGG